MPARTSPHSTSIHNTKSQSVWRFREASKAMSLRYMSRVGARAAQAVRESTGRSVKDKAQSSSASMARSGGGRPAPAAGSVESGRASAAAVARRKAEEEKRRRAEQALRTVMFLSVWGAYT